jgi:hypothetical protein
MAPGSRFRLRKTAIDVTDTRPGAEASPAVAAPDARQIVSEVQETWAEVLELAAFGPHDDFFELGGHSLMAASAVARLGERLGRQLPPHALFAAPTPAEMAELIAEIQREPVRGLSGGVTPHHPDWVAPLQLEGDGRPVFVFPAGHNETVSMAIEARVADHTGRDHPFWGFRRDDPGLDHARSGGVPAMAAAYIAQMRRIQERGPYLLYANCAGGIYAWEMARQLLSGGEVASLLFYEVPFPGDGTESPPVITPATVSPPPAAADAYRPLPLPVNLTLIMTKFWHERGWGARWGWVALGAVETVVIPGETEKAFVRREERIARLVREWIDTAESRLREGL